MAWYFWLIIAAVLILVLFLAGYAAIGLVFLKNTFMRRKGLPEAATPNDVTSPEAKKRQEIIRKNRGEFNALVEKWEKEEPAEEITATSETGEKLYARIVKGDRDSHKWFILCHGYMGTGEWMMPYAYVYNKWGRNCLVPDMKAHGRSEGKWYGMGWEDRRDVVLWANEILKRDPEAEIVLQGVSMGGASVMMALGEPDLPKAVKGCIDDCGFVNVWDVFISTMEERLGENKSHRVLMCGSRMHKILKGWWFQYADARKSLRRADPDLPVLFVQGELDDFVKVRMTEEAYKYKTGKKDIRIFSDTDHGNSYVRHPEEYFKTVSDWLKGYGL